MAKEVGKKCYGQIPSKGNEEQMKLESRGGYDQMYFRKYSKKNLEMIGRDLKGMEEGDRKLVY